MSMTLVEAAKLSNDKLQAGIIEKFYRDDPILNMLLFKDIVGNGLTYNVENSEPSVEWYDEEDERHESTGTATSTTAVLKILGGDVDVYNFSKRTRSNINDVRQEAIDKKVKAMRKEFLDTLFYGSNSSNGKQPDGLQTLVADTTYNTVHAGSSTGTALAMEKLDEMIDLVRGGKLAGLWMSRQMRRSITKYLRGAGAISTGRDIFGRQIMTWGPDDTPLYVTDYIVDTETASSGAYAAKTGGGNTTIFGLRFENEALCALQNGGLMVTPIGELEMKSAERIRFEWYVSFMLQNIRTIAKLDGIDCDGTVTA